MRPSRLVWRRTLRSTRWPGRASTTPPALTKALPASARSRRLGLRRRESCSAEASTSLPRSAQVTPSIPRGRSRSSRTFGGHQPGGQRSGSTAPSTSYGVPAFFTLVALPLVPLGLWLGSLGQGCIQDLVQFGARNLSLQPDWYCLPAIVVVGTVPALVMAVMLQRGAPLSPHVTTTLGGLAAAALGNVGLRLFHPQDASVMVLLWQFGTVLVLSALAGCTGRHLLSWRAMAADGRRAVIC
ncbi:MAG: DUF1109 family protein [Acidobacteria bacterium]|nr:DUF1109 family protein [Acidobacteriota bacterium]